MALPPETTAVASELSVAPHYPVARDDESDSVVPVGPSNRALSARAVSQACEFFIGAGRAVRNLDQAPPDLQLKGSTGEVQRDVEGGAPAVEIFGNLALALLQVSIASRCYRALEPAPHPFELSLEHGPVRELEKAEALLGGECHHGAERCQDSAGQHDVEIGGASRRLSKEPLKGLTKARERFVPSFECHGGQAAAVSDLFERQPQPARSLVCVERHSVVCLKPTAYPGRVDSDLAKIRITPAKAGLLLEPRDYFLKGLLGVLVGFIFRLSSSSFFFLLCLCMRRDKELLVVQNFAVEKDFR